MRRQDRRFDEEMRKDKTRGQDEKTRRQGWSIMNPILILDAYGLSSNQFQPHVTSSISSHKGNFFAMYYFFLLIVTVYMHIYTYMCILNIYIAYFTHNISKSFKYTPFQGAPCSKTFFCTLQNFFQTHMHIIHKSFIFSPARRREEERS